MHANKPDTQELLPMKTQSRRADQNFKTKERLQRLLRHKPQYVPALKEMGKILVREGSYDKAASYFNRVLKVRPDDFIALTDLGYIYSRKRDYPRAVRYYQKALDKDPDSTFALAELGVLYNKQGFSSKALEVFRAALAKDPGNVRILSLLALAYNQRSEIDEANACLKQLAERSKDSRQLLKKSEEQIKRKDAQLVASARVTTANAMATCFAHQINNPLQNIQSIIFNLKETDSNEPSFIEGLARIEHQADRIHELIEHLNKLMRDEGEDFKYVAITQPILSAFELFEEQLHSKEISVDLSDIENVERPPMVYGNPIKLEQVFINLIANARDALMVVSNPEITIRMFRPSDGRITIYFCDNGEGISDENLNHIFDSLFSTKPKGTGLGLWLCYSIIHQMNGTIDVESAVGSGTKFIISLPTKGQGHGEA